MGHALAPRLKPIHLILISLAALGTIAVVTTLATLQRTAPTRVSGSRPAGAQLQIPTEISGTVVDEAPTEPVAQASRPRAARSSGQAGTGAAAQAPTTSGGGGSTNVTIDNGSSDTSTESGGSNVNNSAAVSARTGSGAGGEEP